MLLDDDALSALWTISDQGGPRPEFLIPVLYLESGFDPTIQNRAGLPYFGIAQTNDKHLAALGTTPAAFLAMSQGNQIRLAVAPYFRNVVSTYGPIRSATRAYQANFEPASLARARLLSQIVEPSGSASYRANAAALDPLRHGAITVSDLALVMARAVHAGPSQQAIARAYALRPTEKLVEPIYGHDFTDPLLTAAALALAAVAASLR